MCGRFTLFTDDADLAALFEVDALEGEHLPAYNQAPSQLIRAVVEDGERLLTLQKWGLVPSWARPEFKPLINARAETLTEKPSFRTAALRRRCLLPTNGYYEWSNRQPYFLSDSEAPVLAMAGIYEVKRSRPEDRDPQSGDEGSAPLVTAAVVTRAATDSLGHLHPRMPLFIPQGAWDEWLSKDLRDKAEVESFISSLPTPELTPRPVSKAVGDVRVTAPEQIFGQPPIFG